MIKSFKCKETEKIFSRSYSAKFSHSIHRGALRRLRMLHRVNDLNDLRVPPGNKLEFLKGDREGQLSIRINNQWRICFEWYGNEAYNVEIVDYH